MPPSIEPRTEAATKTSIRRPGIVQTLASAAPAVVLLVYLAVLLWRFLLPDQLYLSFFTDDFFYYVEVAKHLVQSGQSTFNGIQLTNGYHPLWLVVVTAVCALFGSHKLFLVAIVVLIWVLVVATFVQLRRMQAETVQNGRASLALALLSITFMAVISRTGMEVSLALFLLVVFWRRLAAYPLELQTSRQAFVSGLLGSAVVLGRVDCALMVGVYCLLCLVKPYASRRAALRNAAPFLAGLTPVAIYLLLNRVVFGTLLPISGIAKNLKPSHLPSPSTLHRLLTPDSLNLLFTWPAVLCVLVYLIRCHPLSDLRAERVRLCLALHPLLFYTILSFTSDWFLWTWYLYPLVPILALLGPSVVDPFPRLSADEPVNRKQSGLVPWSADTPFAVVSVAVALYCIAVIFNLGRLNQIEVPILQAAKQLHDFSVTHPGRYAMGDRAGTPAYLMDQPFLQLEGLMADPAFLERIRQRQELLGALRQLGVDYYVSSEPKIDDGCYVVNEPAKAGPASPKMTGRICMRPVLQFNFDAIHTVVFDLRQQAASG